MKIDGKITPTKKVILYFFILFIVSQFSYSQCNNPTPTGDVTQTFCASENKTIGDLIVFGGDIVWYDAPIGGTICSLSKLLIDEKIYYADDVSGTVNNCSSPRLAVTAIIYGNPPADTDLFVGNCASASHTIADLNATGTNIEWYDAQFGGNLLDSSLVLVGGQKYWVQQTENGCISSRLPTTFIIVNPAAATIEPVQSFCDTPIPLISDLQTVEPDVVWYNSETSEDPLNPNTPLINGNSYWGANSEFPCESIERIETTVVIDTTPNAGSDFVFLECSANLTNINLFDLLGGIPNTTGIWTGPSQLSNNYLGTFEPGIHLEGIYTYTVSSVLGICDSDTATVTITSTSVEPPTTTEANQFFCDINNPTISNLNATGNNIAWHATEFETNHLNDTELLIDGEDYWATQIDLATGCESETRLKVTVTINTTLPPTSTEENQTFCEYENATIAFLNVTGTNITWYDTEISTTPLNTADLLVNGDYWVTQTNTSTGCESSSRLVINVTIIPTQPPPTTNEPHQTFCEINNPTVADLNAIGNGIDWHATEFSNTDLLETEALIDGEDYWATQLDPISGCESLTRLKVTVSIINTLAPTTTETNQQFCHIENATIANLNVTATNVLWYASEISTIPLNNTEILIDGENYWASQTDTTTGCESVNRLKVTVTINTTQPPITSEENQTFCQNSNPTIANLIITGTNTLWYATETSTILLNNSVLLIDGEDYWATQTNASTGCESETRLKITVTIFAALPAPTTSETHQTFCDIENPTISNLNVTGTNLHWYDTEISTIQLNNLDTLIDGEDYWVSQIDPISGCESNSRLKITVTVNNTPLPTTTEVTQTFCIIENATIANLDVQGSNLIWYDSENSTTPLNISDLLINGEDYWASQSDLSTGCESTLRLQITVIITDEQAPTVTTENQTFCEIDAATVANLNASGNGILWYANSTETIPLNNAELLINGEDYWASQTNTVTGCESENRIMVTVSINITDAPTTNEVNQTFCEHDNATTTFLNVTGTNLIWYTTQTSLTPINTSEILIDGEDYWATQTNATTGCESVDRLMVTVTIIPTQEAPTTDEPHQTFCEINDPTIADLVAIGNNLDWHDTETSLIDLDLSEPLVDGEDYWATQLDPNSGCESVDRLRVTVTIIATEAPTTLETTQTFCEVDNPTIANLNVSGTQILWYEAENTTTPLDISILLIDGEDYWATQTEVIFGCESSNRLMVTVKINNEQPPTTSEETQTFCEIDNPTIANLNASGTNILWYATENATIPLAASVQLINGEDYWASQTNLTLSCESESRLVVTTLINTTEVPTTLEANQSFCDNQLATIANLTVTGNAILWYDTATSSTPLNNSDVLINGEDYWASQTDDITGCESINRLAISVTIISPPEAPIITEPIQVFCEIDNPTIANLSAQGSNIHWHDTENSIEDYNTTDVLIDGEDYWAAQIDPNSNCESTNRIKVTASINSTAAPTTISDNQEFCINANATIKDLDINGTNLIWYDSESSTVPLNNSDILINGEDYWATQTNIVTGCESITRLLINATIIDLATPTANQTVQEFCIQNNPTIADLEANGEHILWFYTATSTTSIPTNTPLINGGAYWAASVDETIGCESASRLLIIVKVNTISPPSIEEDQQTFCSSSSPTLTNLEVTGNNIVWYASETDLIPLDNSNLLEDGKKYWASQSNLSKSCNSTRISVSVTLTDAGTPEINEFGNEFCVIDKPTISDLNFNITPTNLNNTIIWYDSFPDGFELNSTELLIDGDTYIAVEKNSNGCISITPLEITITLDACDAYDVEIFDGFSPNEDGVNDTFKIGNLRELYPNFEVEFYNRWGKLVYTANTSKPDWNGRFKGSGELVPSGVYYFIIYFNSETKKPIQQRLYLSK